MATTRPSGQTETPVRTPADPARTHAAAARGTLRSRLIRGGGWALAGKGAAAFSGLATNILLARLLQPADLGTYYLAASVAMVGGIVGVIGLDQTVVRLIASARYGGGRTVMRRASTAAAISSLLVVALVIATRDLWALRLFDSPALRSLAFFVAAWAVAVVFQRLTAEGFRGLHDIRAASFFDRAAPSVLLVVALALPVALGRTLGLTAAIVTTVVTSSIAVLLGSSLLQRRLPDERVEVALDYPALLSMSLPLLVSSTVFYALVHVDIWLVGAQFSAEEVALYGAASKLVTLVAMPLMIVNAVLPPMIAELHAAGDNPRMERVVRVAASVAGLPAAVVLIAFVFFGRAILGGVYGDFYAASAAVLAVLSVGQLVNVWAGSCGYVLIMTGNGPMMMRITAATGALTVAGGLVGARLLGIEGVAGAMAAGLLLQNLVMVMTVRRKIGIWTHVTIRPSDLRSIRSTFRKDRR